jgi:4-amino-4-deoxy-L-arabinose transferase-like glycosyltransferase
MPFDAPNGSLPLSEPRRPLRVRWPILGELILVTLVLAATWLSRGPSLGQPLVEVHPFRQTETAYPALIFSQRGVDLLHPMLPTLGPPFELPFEFPLFQAIASFVMNAGLPPDPALRMTNLAFFVVTELALYLIVRRRANAAGAMAALLAFAASPFGLVWSRTAMIEYLATAASLAWLLCGLIWADSRRSRWLLLAFAAGSVAALVKITTAAFWALPVAAVILARDSKRVAAAARAAGAIAAPLVVGLAWLAYAGGVRSRNEFAAVLSGTALTDWGFGSVAQRLDPDEWTSVANHGWLALGGGLLAGATIALAIAAIIGARERRLWIALAGLVAIAPLILFNLYSVHDYYWIAVTPAASALIGGGAAEAWRRLRAARQRLSASLAFGAALIIGLSQSSDYWGPIYAATAVDPESVLPAAAALAEKSRPEDLALVGPGWSPAILYYARRSGLAIPEWAGDVPALEHLREAGYRVAEFTRPAEAPMPLLHEWPWVGVTGSLTYVMGERPTEMRGADLIAYLGHAPWPAPDGAASLLDRPLRIPCDAAPLQLPTGQLGTWLELAPASLTARLWIVNGLAPVPVGQWVFLSGSASHPGVGGTVICNGADSLVVQRILDAAVP